jgi:hypothetical protein
MPEVRRLITKAADNQALTIQAYDLSQFLGGQSRKEPSLDRPCDGSVLFH